MLISGFKGQFNPAVSASVANGAQLSGEIATGGFCLCGLQLPAALTSVAVTFMAATASGGTYQPVYNAAGLLSYTIAQGRFIAIDPKDFQGIAFLKLNFGSAEGAARTIVCSMKGI